MDCVFPIRGEYRLDVSATDRRGRRLERSFILQVRENRAKTAVLAGFVAAATPSFGTRARPVLLFMLVVLAGLAAGRLSQKRRVLLPWPGKRVKIHTKEAS